MKELHPLINSDSAKHYNDGDTSAIEEMEKELSLREMIGFVSGNIWKYNYRKDKKGQLEADIKKIATYIAYQNALYDLLEIGVDETLSVHNAWKVAGREWRYR